MIEKVRIRGYRKFRDLTFIPKSQLNILVGDNDSGKSTIVEAITLAMTNRMNGRSAQDELNPYWFNQDLVSEFFTKRAEGESVALPCIDIELYLTDEDDVQRLHGAHNSEPVTFACPGIRFMVLPDPEFEKEIEEYVASGTSMLPVEYYRIEWRSFADDLISSRPKALSAALIDSRTIRSSGGIDYHLRQMLADHLEPDEKAALALAYRKVKKEMTDVHLASVNDKMSQLEGGLRGEPLALAMDQSARTSWDSHITPHVDSIPFALVGQGQQSAVKITLALGRSSASVRVIMVEEPENHLSHTSLNQLMKNIESHVRPNQQMFVATHSSFVLNRLGLDNLHFVGGGAVAHVSNISKDTVRYFKRLPGYDTLRLMLAAKVVLVEGPSDEIVFERFYVDKYNRRPIEDGIDVVSMRGLAVRRFLEICKLIGKKCAALRDLDDNNPDDIINDLGDLVDNS